MVARVGTLDAMGEGFTLRFAAYAAEVGVVGATLKSFSHDRRDLVLPAPDTRLPAPGSVALGSVAPGSPPPELDPFARGAVLAPWPNRVIDARYEFAGRGYELPVTEPARGHALHGLVRGLEFALVQCDECSVQLRACIEPTPGYPWRVEVRVEYRLSGSGLQATLRARNLSRSAAPFGAGWHPYLVPGSGSVDDWVLEMPAGQVLRPAPATLAPTGLFELAGPGAAAGVSGYDFSRPRSLRGARLDHAYTRITATADAAEAGAGAEAVTAGPTAGLAVMPPATDAQVRRVRLWAARPGEHADSGIGANTAAAAPESPAGPRVLELRLCEGCDWVQLYTLDTDGPLHRSAIAVEPMSCAPNAFNDTALDFPSGLHVLPPWGGHSPDFVQRWELGLVSEHAA